jgi:hypothetical protein
MEPLHQERGLLAVFLNCLHLSRLRIDLVGAEIVLPSLGLLAAGEAQSSGSEDVEREDASWIPWCKQNRRHVRATIFGVPRTSIQRAWDYSGVVWTYRQAKLRFFWKIQINRERTPE